MKKMNNKGFTLVELLAVLVILLTILTLAIPSITSSVERNKEKMNKKKIDIIEAAAESYVNLYKNTVFNSEFDVDNECGILIPISKIKEKGILTGEDLNDADGNPIEGFVCYDDASKKYIYCKTESGCGNE